MNDRDRPGIDEWRAELDEHLGSGGCMEAAQAASEERERENTETRRGVVRKVDTAMASVVGLGASTDTVQAAPDWPMTPMSTAAHCTGELADDCLATAGNTMAACYPCRATRQYHACVACASALLVASVISADECCKNGEWVRPGEEH